MIREAVILAGGLGTRLQAALNVPKCMAIVSGKPFLHYVISHLKQQGIERFIFSLGYMHEVVATDLSKSYPSLNYQLSIEKKLLGTGGAVQLACALTSEPDILIVNGDTLFKIVLNELASFHAEQHAACTIALKPMKNTGRYGKVEINKDGYVQSFKEKYSNEEGLINGGVYALDVSEFLKMNLPSLFSFEKDYLERYYPTQKMMGLVQDEYFIDIGIPEDLVKVNNEIKL